MPAQEVLLLFQLVRMLDNPQSFYKMKKQKPQITEQQMLMLISS